MRRIKHEGRDSIITVTSSLLDTKVGAKFVGVPAPYPRQVVIVDEGVGSVEVVELAAEVRLVDRLASDITVLVAVQCPET